MAQRSKQRQARLCLFTSRLSGFCFFKKATASSTAAGPSLVNILGLPGATKTFLRKCCSRVSMRAAHAKGSTRAATSVDKIASSSSAWGLATSAGTAPTMPL